MLDAVVPLEVVLHMLSRRHVGLVGMGNSARVVLRKASTGQTLRHGRKYSTTEAKAPKQQQAALEGKLKIRRSSGQGGGLRLRAVEWTDRLQ